MRMNIYVCYFIYGSNIYVETLTLILFMQINSSYLNFTCVCFYKYDIYMIHVSTLTPYTAVMLLNCFIKLNWKRGTGKSIHVPAAVCKFLWEVGSIWKEYWLIKAFICTLYSSILSNYAIFTSGFVDNSGLFHCSRLKILRDLFNNLHSPFT